MNNLHHYIKSFSTFVFLTALMMVSTRASATTVVWNGPATTNTANDWSASGNWSGGTPTSANDMKFFDVGAIPGVSNINNTVDTTTTIGSLQYGNTNNNHTTLITNAVTLNITGANGLAVTTSTTTGTNFGNLNQLVFATVTGTGGALVINNSSANILVGEGAVATTTAKATLDLSGLDTFNATVSKIGVGTLFLGNASQRLSGTLYLAKANILTMQFTTTNVAIAGNANETTNALEIGCGAGNPGVSFLYLGQTNSIFTESIGTAKEKGVASMLFNPVFIAGTPAALFRGAGGGANRVKVWAIGDNSAASGNNSSSGCSGTNDFTGGTVDALVDLMFLGRDRLGNNTSATANNFGKLIFTGGTIDVNTLKIGDQEFANAVNLNPCVGNLIVNGNSALLRVNTVLTLASTANNQTNAWNSSGVLNVTNGTVLANSITVGQFATNANSAINLTNATLIVSNSLASLTTPLTNFYTANSLIGLTVGSAGTRVALGKLTTGGTTNLIQLNSVTVFTSYPQTIPLIKYAGSILGTGYNFGLTNVPEDAPGAYLSNDVLNSAVDLVLPNDPRPVITSEPTSYSGSPGDNVTASFSVGISATSITPLAYQWYSIIGGVTNVLTDGANASGSTNFGTATGSFSLTNAQTADNGNYYVVITNVYGSVTSSPLALLTISGTPIQPGITGPTNLTVIQGNNVTINDSVSGSPLPVLQWFDQTGSPIPNATNASLTLSNVQFSQNGFSYSLIASNSAGLATNITTLTVIIPPTITSQPVSVVVTNTQTASFTVGATGVPSPAYQWSKNGVPISSAVNNTATNATFTIASVSSSDINTYSVTITNLAGTTNSATVSLTVNSTMATTALMPASSATGICYDTPLYITFNSTPVLRNTGTIKIYNVTNSTTPVDTINLGSSASGLQAHSLFSGDTSITINYFPVIITGSTAAIYPHSGVMTSNQTYYVTIDDGAFADTSGAYFAGITATNVWQFTTKPTGPANPTNMAVAIDGSGDFVTVQGAVDSVAPGNNNYTVVNVHNGNYVEIVDISGKNNITFRGQSRNGTTIGYANNNNNNPSTATRAAFKVNSSDIKLENLTLTNATPQGGSQAETLLVYNNGLRCIANNCTIVSRQDTVLINASTSQCLFNNCEIMGNFDYIWGQGVGYFYNCVLHTISGSSSFNLTAARTLTSGTLSAATPWVNPNGSIFSAYGFSFVGCTLEADSGVIGVTMAGSNGTQGGLDSWANCVINTNVYVNPAFTLATNYVFWQYNNIFTDGVTSVAFTNLQTIGMTNNDPRLLAATNVTTWFSGWTPQLAPNILTNPANQSVSGGGAATFSVSATGISAPQYQWLKNGTPIAGQTNSSLTINPASANDVASYSVIVSNNAGTVISSNASLAVGNTAPSLTPVSDQTVNVGVNVSVANIAADPDVPAQTLNFTLPVAPAGATVDGSGNFSWRPTVSFAGTSNLVNVVVTDNGSPNLSATNSFNVIVNPLTPPVAGTPTYSGGSFSVTVSGQTGPDYELQATTNLVGGTWIDIAATNSPTSPFTLTDTNAAAQPMQFYRIVTGPPLP